MYVAITRAKRELSLHFARRRMSYGKLSAYPPSRFLDELPKKCLSGDDWRAASPPVTVESHAARRFNGAVVQRKVVGGFCTGDTVSHPKYGLGIIIKLQGRGIDAQAEIAFKKTGITKTFKTALAPLQKTDKKPLRNISYSKTVFMRTSSGRLSSANNGKESTVNNATSSNPSATASIQLPFG